MWGQTGPLCIRSLPIGGLVERETARVHRETGRTFSEILLEKRMGRAAPLLKNTAFPIEEIASLLGYGNASNFYKAFKSYYGTTPREHIGSPAASS